MSYSLNMAVFTLASLGCLSHTSGVSAIFGGKCECKNRTGVGTKMANHQQAFVRSFGHTEVKPGSYNKVQWVLRILGVNQHS